MVSELGANVSSTTELTLYSKNKGPPVLLLILLSPLGSSSEEALAVVLAMLE
jgi:hypothetical protein